MSLAWKELKYSKKKYILIELILVLLIFMVLFLSGLASGLARAVSSVIENEDAAYYVLSDDADNLVTMSSLTDEQLATLKEQTSDDVTPVNIQRMTIYNQADLNTKLDITYVALENDSFLMPEINQGTALNDEAGSYTIILNDTYEDDGIKLGDIIEDSNSGIEMTVVGFTSDEMYGHSPAGIISMDTYTAIHTAINPSYEKSYDAFAIHGNDIEGINLEKTAITDKETIIKNIPGYSAEQGTIKMILWVLVIVSAAILGVFFYVITIQKQKQFGVMKAIGMGMGQLTGMIVSEVLILALMGMVIGNGLAFGMSAMLPKSMPFYLQGSQALAISAVFVLISIACSLISTRKVATVDPMIVIGGNE